MPSSVTEATWTFAAVVGFIYLGVSLYQILDFLTFHFWLSSDPLKAYRLKRQSQSKGSPPRPYALITGSSGGIGFGYAQSLVKRGFGVILLSNDAAGLTAAKNRLEREQHDAAIEVVQMEAASASPQDMQRVIIDGLIRKKGLHVTILINNVGGTPVPFPFQRLLGDYSAADIDAFIAVNAGFMAQLTRLMVPVFTADSTSSNPQRSLIINMSSSGRLGFPYLSMYSATKAFDAAFSVSMAREFEATGVPIDCIAIVPGEVVSTGNDVGHGWTSPSAQQYAKMVLDRIDTAVRRRKLVTSPYWIHTLQIALLGVLPESTLTKISTDIMADKMKAFEEKHQKGK